MFGRGNERKRVSVCWEAGRSETDIPRIWPDVMSADAFASAVSCAVFRTPWSISFTSLGS